MQSAGVFKYLDLATTDDARKCIRHEYSKNVTEVTGQLLLAAVKHITILEAKCLEGAANLSWKIMQSHNTHAVALTALALTAATYAFYSTLPLGGIVLGFSLRNYLFMHVEAAILGTGLRAFGRFSNPEVMECFYKNCGDIPEGQEWPKYQLSN